MKSDPSNWSPAVKALNVNAFLPPKPGTIVKTGGETMVVTRDGVKNVGELVLHNQIIKFCNDAWPRIKYIHANPSVPSTIQKGCQDFTLFYNGKVFCIECKSRDGKLSNEQRAWAVEMAKQGFTIHIISEFWEFEKLVSLSDNNSVLTLDALLALVIKHFDVSEEELKSRQTKYRILFPRLIFFGLCEEFTGESNAEIGRFLGGRDHGGVIHSKESFRNLLEQNAKFRQDYAVIRGVIKAAKGPPIELVGVEDDGQPD